MTTSSGTTDSAGESSVGSLKTPTWYFSSSFASTSAFNAFDALLRPTHDPTANRNIDVPVAASWVPEASGEGENFVGHFEFAAAGSTCWSLQELNDIDVAVAALNEEKQSGSGIDLQVASAAVSLTFLSAVYSRLL